MHITYTCFAAVKLLFCRFTYLEYQQQKLKPNTNMLKKTVLAIILNVSCCIFFFPFFESTGLITFGMSYLNSSEFKKSHKYFF